MRWTNFGCADLSRASDVLPAMAAAFREAPQRKSHLTSASPSESVGRWKRELEPSLRAQLEAALTPCVNALGYD